MPLSKTGAELLLELIPQRCERGATMITSTLPFDEWPVARSFRPMEVTGPPFGTERRTGALPERLTQQANIRELNGERFRPAQSRARKSIDTG